MRQTTDISKPDAKAREPVEYPELSSLCDINHPTRKKESGEVPMTTTGDYLSGR
jgi:hypothetical protein